MTRADGMSDVRLLISRLLPLARRLAPAAADDLVQETLIAGHTAARLTEADLPWLRGVLRNQSRMHHRATARRRRRETGAQLPRPAEDAPPPDSLPDLPPALRAVLLLSLAGCSRDEVRHILGLSDTALRQRLTALRRKVGHLVLAAPDRTSAWGPARARLRQLPAPLHASVRLASHDPDGFGLLFSSQNTPPRQQTNS